MRTFLLLPFLLAGCGTDDSSTDDTGADTGDTGADTGDTGDTGDTADTGSAATTRVRVLHLSPDAPAVDVFVAGVADPVVSSLAFPEGTAYLEVPADTYTFQVAVAGSPATDAVLTVPDLPLAAGASYTAVAVGYVADIGALALVDDDANLASTDFRVQVVHAAPGIGEVDIWNITGGNASPLLTDVPFLGNAVLDLPAGAYSVGFDVNADAVPDVSFDLPELPAGLVVNLFATNDAAGNPFLVAQLPDGTTARIDPAM